MGPLEYAAAVIGLTIALCVAAVLVWRAAALNAERRRRERQRRAALVELTEQHAAIEEACNMRTSYNGTTIKTDAGNVYTYTGPDGAPNWLDDAIGDAGEYLKDEYGIWHMDDAAAVWWIEWARREERIQSALEDADDATARRAREAYGADYETSQRAACDALGIEY